MLNPEKDFVKNLEKNSCYEIENIIEIMKSYFKGKDVNFSLKILNFNLLTEFDKKVLMAVYKIPRGQVKTYGEIAKLINNPKAYRAVGNSLRKNPFPIIIPCHRVIRSDGSLGGFQSGINIKKILLNLELE